MDFSEFVHTGPETLAGRYLRRFWQPVACCHELRAGQALPVRILSEDFTLYRGATGTAHLVGNRCAHRGTQLSVGWVEDDCIRCFYHGWKYDGAGQCVEQPAEGESFASKVRIASYPVQEYSVLSSLISAKARHRHCRAIQLSKIRISPSTSPASNGSAITSTISTTRWTMPMCALFIGATATRRRIMWCSAIQLFRSKNQTGACAVTSNIPTARI